MLSRGNMARRRDARSEITALVGADAAQLGRRSTRWLGVGGVLVFPTVELLGLLAIITRTEWLWFGVLFCFVGSLGCVIPTEWLGRRASRAASAHLSRIEGRAITVGSGGRSLAAWQKEIARAHQKFEAEERQREKQAANDVHNQEWLDEKQQQWEEYRSKHPQGRA